MELSQFGGLFEELTTLLCVYTARNGDNCCRHLSWGLEIWNVKASLCWQHGSLSVTDIKHSCYRIRRLRALLFAFPTTFYIFQFELCYHDTPDTSKCTAPVTLPSIPLLLFECVTQKWSAYILTISHLRSLHVSHRLLKAGSKCKQHQQQQKPLRVCCSYRSYPVGNQSVPVSFLEFFVLD